MKKGVLCLFASFSLSFFSSLPFFLATDSLNRQEIRDIETKERKKERKKKKNTVLLEQPRNFLARRSFPRSAAG